MKNKIYNIKKDFDKDIKIFVENKCPKYLEKIKIDYLGKSGKINSLYKEFKKISNEEKKYIGSEINNLKNSLNKIIFENEKILEEIEIKNELENEKINDISLPVNFIPHVGNSHVLSISKNRIINFFINLGFEIFDDSEIDTDYNNFEAINIPKYHPAREMQDTFYIEENLLLRTHTTNFQSKILKNKIFPIKGISLGKVFRKDEDDATHSHQFNQMDFVYVDKNINIGHLKGFLEIFINFFFEEKKNIRYRPSYFPFTEPSVEIDMECDLCLGNGCNKCKNTGFIEILGAGLIHPNIMKKYNISSEYTGLAFGVGIERITMLKYSIEDIRYFYQNNINFLKQFK